jgi:HSP20 family protein
MASIIRYAPARRVSPAQAEINRFFNTFFDSATPVAAARSRRFNPALDVVENEHDYVLRADLPGLSEEDVKIQVQDGVLTISGERKSENEERKDGYYRLERSFGSFRRSLTLPEGTDPQSVTATFERGVLEVHVPKPEEKTPQTIEISVGGENAPVEAEPATDGAAA